MIIGVIEQQRDGIGPITMFLVILMVAAGPVWYTSLGMLAKRLGRRPLVWVGLSFVTSPIGPLVIFPLMLGHIKTASKAMAPPSISA